MPHRCVEIYGSFSLEMNCGRSKFSNEPLAIYGQSSLEINFWPIWNGDVLEGIKPAKYKVSYNCHYYSYVMSTL